MIDVIVVRDPDASNEISVYGSDEANIVDIDLGRSDLFRPEEWAEWAETQRLSCEGCFHRDAQKTIKNVVVECADIYGHDAPEWTQS